MAAAKKIQGKAATAVKPARKPRPNEVAKRAAREANRHPLMLDDHEWDRVKVAEVVCERIASSNLGIIKVLAAGHEGRPLPGYITWTRWQMEEGGTADTIRAMYARAKEQQAEHMGEEMLEIADTARMGKRTKVTEDGTETVTGDAVDRARLQVDARKWLMGKLKPRKYGDATTLRGDPDSPLQLEVRTMIASSDELLAKMRGGKKR